MLFFQQKNVSFGLLSLALSVALFLVELLWPVAFFIFFLSLSFSVFQICRHDNWPTLILWQHLNRNNFRFPFSFLLTRSLVVSALHKTPVAMRFPAKITSSCHTCMLIELFYIGMPVVRTDGRSVGRAGVRSRGYQMHGLPNFVTHGSPLLARAPL